MTITFLLNSAWWGRRFHRRVWVNANGRTYLRPTFVGTAGLDPRCGCSECRSAS